MAHELLILCTGNICRSPMAQVVFGQTLSGWQVASAGLAAVVDSAAAPEAVSTLGNRGEALVNFRARQIDEAMARSAELILTMTRDQKERVELLYPWVRGRAFRLGNWDGFDVEDPYGRDVTAFERALSLIEICAVSWKERLMTMENRNVTSVEAEQHA